MTEDFPAAIASQELSLKLHTHAGNRHGQAMALNDLGVIHQETGDYPRSAASQQKALEIFRDLGDRLASILVPLESTPAQIGGSCMMTAASNCYAVRPIFQNAIVPADYERFGMG